ncbi:MAG: 4Fe-4S dicluster domain-containing protein, partial [Candidatus Bathyarchaeota archaeon]|nr:4Fe-4S dicluster domain-containing protein [Candidatus Bathyarchaeota archaeon]
DLCGGEPKCVEACTRGGWNALETIERSDDYTFKLYAQTPEKITRDVIVQLYGEEWEEEV